MFSPWGEYRGGGVALLPRCPGHVDGYDVAGFQVFAVRL